MNSLASIRPDAAAVHVVIRAGADANKLEKSDV
jgi:hypothetical protein